MVATNSPFTMDALSLRDLRLLEACEDAALYWAIVRPIMDGTGWAVVCAFSSLNSAKKCIGENDLLIAVNSGWKIV